MKDNSGVGSEVETQEVALLLVARLARLPSRAWAEGFLTLVRELLVAADVAEGDPRLVASMPQEGPYPLPVTINNRYVLAPCVRQGRWSLGFVYGAEWEFQPEIKARARAAWRFAPQRNEGLDTPFWLRVDGPNALREEPLLLEGWLEAACAELPRARASANRRAHQPLFFRAAWDVPYRQALLDAAFA